MGRGAWGKGGREEEEKRAKKRREPKRTRESKRNKRKRDGKPRKLAIKYVCMDAFTNSQVRGNRAESRRMRDADAAAGLVAPCSRVAELLPVVFPRDEFITSSRSRTSRGTNQKSLRRKIRRCDAGFPVDRSTRPDW